MLKIYGLKAENIEDGSIFRAHITTVEGKKVVTLVQTMAKISDFKSHCPLCYEIITPETEKNHGSWCK